MHPTAVLGGAGESTFSENEVNLAAAALRDLAKRKGRSPALAAALVDPKVTVYRYTRTARWAGRLLHARGTCRRARTRRLATRSRDRPARAGAELTGDDAEQYGIARYSP